MNRKQMLIVNSDVKSKQSKVGTTTRKQNAKCKQVLILCRQINVVNPYCELRVSLSRCVTLDVRCNLSVNLLIHMMRNESIGCK